MKAITAILMCVLIGLPVSAAAAATTPEGVLAELETVYAAGDTDAYGALLTEDFSYVSKTGAGWGKREDLAGTSKLFQTATATLVFTRNFTIHPGAKPDTWVLQGVPLDLAVTQDSDTKTVHTVITLSVRKDPATGTIRIYRWVESS